MEELSEVITSAEFHPSHCNIFIYSSSKGSIKLGDLRDSALCDNQAKTFEEPEDPASRSFFSEIISSISDIKYPFFCNQKEGFYVQFGKCFLMSCCCRHSRDDLCMAKDLPQYVSTSSCTSLLNAREGKEIISIHR